MENRGEGWDLGIFALDSMEFQSPSPPSCELIQRDKEEFKRGTRIGFRMSVYFALV